MYRIKTGQRDAARRLGVVIRPSTVKNKKLDVYKNGIKVASIGLVGYGDSGHTSRTKNITARQRERQRSAAASIKFATPTSARRREQ